MAEKGAVNRDSDTTEAQKWKVVLEKVNPDRSVGAGIGTALSAH